MSVYYSKYNLNTYSATPYFLAQLPERYPIALVLQKARAFRRLPRNIRILSAKAKQWAKRHNPDNLGVESMRAWYDSAGYELNPSTGARLTDAEIDAQWEDNPLLDAITITDIPIPPGGFPDPNTWEPAPGVVVDDDIVRPTDEQLQADIASHGAEATAKEYGIPIDDLPTANARTIEADRSEFFVRAMRVLNGPYLSARANEQAYLLDALEYADIYDDLGGRALEIFDAAEASDSGATENARSFFADCPRDEHGYCLPEGAGGGERVPEHELIAAQQKAIAKAQSAPEPTAAEKQEAKEKLAELGANTYRRNLVGNSKDRARRREALLKEFGDGKTCPCVYCGVKIGEGTLEQDKIRTTAEGGRYRLPNLVPSCSGCNKSRGDLPFKEIKWKAQATSKPSKAKK